MSDRTTKFRARILRKQDNRPRYIVIRPEHVAGRIAAFSAEVSLNDHAPFMRNIRPWGKGSDVFFFNLTEVQCAMSGLATNEECVVTLKPIG